MKLEKSFKIADDDAIERLQALTDYWSTKYGVRADWFDGGAHMSGKVMGVKFDGSFTIGSGVLKADIKAGFLAEKLGAKSYVDRKLDDYLDPGQSVEGLRARLK